MRVLLLILASIGIMILDLIGGHRKKTEFSAARATDDLLMLATCGSVGLSLLLALVTTPPRGPIAATLLAVGVATWGAGMWVRYSAMRELASDYSLTPVRPEHQLVTSGVYAAVRHPGYLGLVLQFAGLSLIAGSPWALIGPLWISACVILRVRVEEELLEDATGGAYSSYCAVTRWRLIPHVY